MKQDPYTYPRPLYQNYELLADYVDGLLNMAHQKQIEQELGDSEEAASIVDGIRHYYSVHGHDREGLEAYLDALAVRFQQQLTPSNPAKIKVPLWRQSWLRMAAIIFLLAALIPAFVWLLRPNPLSTDQLIAQQLETPYPLPNVQRGEVQDLRNEAYMAYNDGNYATTIEKLQISPIDSLQQFSSFDTFYLGMSHLYLGHVEQAIELLKTVEESRNPRFEQQARWYVALAQLQKGDPALGKQYLKKIIQIKGHFKRKEAEILLGLD